MKKADHSIPPTENADQTPLTAAEIRAKLAEHRAAHDAAAAEAQAMREATAGKLLHASNAEMEAHDAEIRRADRASERAALFLELLQPQLEAAEYREDQAERQKLYESALAAHEEARVLILEKYPKAAQEIVTILTRLGELEEQIDAANAKLPDDVRYIQFEDFRGHKGSPSWTETVTETYFVDRYGEESRPACQYLDGELIYNTNEYSKMTREKKIRHSLIPAQFPPRLRSSVELPPAILYGPPIWEKK